MPDAIYEDPRLAALYDTFDGERDDLAAYVDLARELEARDVVDLGCGTGALALLLAASGCRVVGVDPAAASLEVARTKPGAGQVRWVLGDASTLPHDRADLVTMTGNVAQVFLTETDWHATLRGAHAALRPGGHLVFETRRPDRRAWEDWAADTSPRTLVVPGVGQVEHRRQVLDVDLPFVRFQHQYRIGSDGAVLSSDSTLRFWRDDEILGSLDANGYEVVEVRDAPDRPGREWIYVAHRR
ncbi:class I SAM-dependent methyltransferase [Nocardioides aurantiacus]|uniref:Methyltransferase family protein n=1 Tax=Nocardioides aurantiacus TaxID=86796 RepID=A0A3N2CTL2_9ACTN|nr:class I SAM-dependent methyltransferase [Nocardioides aurantiacus]ROR90877.1 methyltransferase family protein [Nocardioides aurantiacus]